MSMIAPCLAPSESSPSARRRATTSPTLFATHAPAGTKVILRGALDGLSDAEVDTLRPENGADTLYTRLRGGRDVKISKKAVIARSPAAFAKLRADGCDVLVYACTGDFPPLAGDEGVVFPSRVLNGLATGLLPRGRLGILIPLRRAGRQAHVEMGAARTGSRGRSPGAQCRRRRGRGRPRAASLLTSPTSSPWIA